MPVSANWNESVIELDRHSWDELGKLAKVVENEIDAKLLTLGRLTLAALRSHRYDGLRIPVDSPLGQAERLVDELQASLVKLATIIDALAGRSEQAGGSSLHILQRHRDIYLEYSKELRKTKV